MGRPLYRGKEIGSRRQLTETCLDLLREGQGKRLYAILPHICLIRSECFLAPLIRLLRFGQTADRLFAAIALGSLGDRRAVAPLVDFFSRPAAFRGKGCQSLQTAVIFALGETGTDEAIEPLLRIFSLARHGDVFRQRRKRLVMTALGTLAQHGSRRAVEVLLENAQPGGEEGVRARAVSELGVAFWHCPNSVPDSIWDRFVAFLEDRSGEVREAAEAALDNLAQLGCRKAEAVFQV